MFIALLLAIALVFLQMLPIMGKRRRKRSSSTQAYTTQEIMDGLSRKDDGILELYPYISQIVHSATTALGGLLMGLSGTETALVSDEEEGEAWILWNFGYKNICKKKCCYKCCEVNKIICLLQGGPNEFYIET